MSVSAEVVRGVAFVGIFVGWIVLFVSLRYLKIWFVDLINPVWVAIRLWFGTMVLCVGLWFLRLGSRVADIHISLSFPEVTHE
jgi:hypothetical protein